MNPRKRRYSSTSLSAQPNAMRSGGDSFIAHSAGRAKKSKNDLGRSDRHRVYRRNRLTTRGERGARGSSACGPPAVSAPVRPGAGGPLNPHPAPPSAPSPVSIIPQCLGFLRRSGSATSMSRARSTKSTIKRQSPDSPSLQARTRM